MNGSIDVVMDLTDVNSHECCNPYKPADVTGTTAFPKYIEVKGRNYDFENDFINFKVLSVQGSGSLTDEPVNPGIDLMKLQNIMKIDSMAKFNYNWDGDGGLAFSESAISLFKQVINNLEKQPQIAPTGRNSLYMQYELDNGSMLAYEVSKEKTEEVYIPCGDYSNIETKILKENIIKRIRERVNQFYGIKSI